MNMLVGLVRCINISPETYLELFMVSYTVESLRPVIVRVQ